MTERTQALPIWFPYMNLACAAAAGVWWLARPRVGGWPLVLALAPWATSLARTGRLTRRTPFDLPLVLFLLTAGLGVWAAYDRQAAWSRFWLIVGGVLLFYALVNAAGSSSTSPAGARVWLLAALGASIAVYFMFTHDWAAYPPKMEGLTRLGRGLGSWLPQLPGPRFNPNVAGGMLIALLPFAGLAVYVAWQGTSTRRPGLTLGAGLGLLTLMLLGLVMTASRGAWIALAAGLLLGGLIVATSRLHWRCPRQRVWVVAGLLALALATGLGLEIALLAGLVDVSGTPPSLASWLNRVDFQRYSLTLVRDYALVGAGLDNFEMLYSTYGQLVHVGFITHSHNLYLDVAIAQGIPGLLALIWMWILFFKAVWQRVLWPLAAGTPAVPVLGLAAATLSLLVVLIHGLADNGLYSREGILLLFVPLAFAVAPKQVQKVSWRWPMIRRPLAVGRWSIIGGGLLLLAVVSRRPFLSLFYSNLGAVHQSQTELGPYTWPEWPIQDAVRRARDLSQPIAEFERALDLRQENATANRRLGMIELSLGEYEAALNHLQRAYVAEPGSATTRQLLGEALIANGQGAEGQALWSLASNDQGQLDLRVFWYRLMGEEERADWLQQAVGE